MKLVIGRPALTLDLARGETLSLDDAVGVCITGHSGVVWVTQERRRSDDFVCAGTSLTVSEPGRTVVEALERGVLQLSIADPGSACAHRTVDLPEQNRPFELELVARRKSIHALKPRHAGLDADQGSDRVRHR
jgi:hypothetical protein